MPLDETFFANSKFEYFIWTEDPSDRPLLEEVPRFLYARSAASAKAPTRADTIAPQVQTPGVKLHIVRKGKRRTSLPLFLNTDIAKFSELSVNSESSQLQGTRDC